jgi:hypothetical protein
MPALRRVRRRTGATAWHLYADAEQADRYVELFTVSSWEEHMLQHQGRLTGSDRDIELRVQALSASPVTAQHFLTAPVE